jgi:hypothetical protein
MRDGRPGAQARAMEQRLQQATWLNRNQTAITLIGTPSSQATT